MTFRKDNSVEYKDNTWLERVKAKMGAGEIIMKNSNYKLLFLKGHRGCHLKGYKIDEKFCCFFKDGDIACLYP